MKICSNCGESNPDRARFCLNCSTAFPEEARSPRVRKTVTILFCDMTGSTSLAEKLDPESVGRIMARYYHSLKTVIEHHGGTVAKFIGDAVMGVFGIPMLHEDDALRAVRAAADVPERVATFNRELGQEFGRTIQVRIGVNTGEVVAGDPSMGDSLITGDAVNVAARLEQAAMPGEILIGRDTYWLVRDAVDVDEIDRLEVRGKSMPLRAFRLRGVKAGVHVGHVRRMDSPLVGRQRQRQLLRQVFDAARQDRSCHLFTLLGPAGVGKSRLAAELVKEVGPDAVILQGRCLPYGDGITYWPVVEILGKAAGVVDSDAPDVKADKIRTFLSDGDGRLLPAGFSESPDVLGPLCDIAGIADAPSTNEQRSWAIRRLFEETGKHRPIIVAFDDIHWAEPALLDLLEHIADWSRGSMILLLCMARPELLDIRPGWGGGKFNATTILLEPLTDEDAKSVMDHLLDESTLPPKILDRILVSAGGNPLYLEEILGMLIDDGILAQSDGRWIVGDLPQFSVPPTIHALIAARLDRLSPEERAAVECAAVIGKEFDVQSVSNLLPPEMRATLTSSLMALVRKDLIRPSESDPTGAGFMFRHLLLQEAAYGGIPKEVRADLHHRFADWIETAAHPRFGEFEEIIGHHLEQAARYLRELGITDERERALRERAAERLGAAGVRAYKRADPAAADNLLRRATDLSAADDPRRLELLPFFGAAKGDRGDLAGAEKVYREAGDIAERLGRDDIRWHSDISLEHLRLATSPYDVDMHDVLDRAHKAIAALEDSGSDLALTLAWFLIVVANHSLGHFAAAGEAAGKALLHARAAGQPRQVADSCGLIMVSGLMGSMPLSDVIDLAHDMLQNSGGNKLLETWAKGEAGIAQILSGRDDEGRPKVEEASRNVEELGLEFGIAAMHAYAGDCDLARGDIPDALQHYRTSHGLSVRTGDEAATAAVAGALSRALFLSGDVDEAERFAAESARGLQVEKLHFRSRWRAPLALLAAHRGDLDEAVRLAVRWKDYVDSTDALLHRGDARMDLAEIYRSAGEIDRARDVALEAEALFAEKESHHDQVRAQRLASQLGR